MMLGHESMAPPLLAVVSLVEVALDSIFAFAIFALIGVVILAALVWSVLVIFREIRKVRSRRR